MKEWIGGVLFYYMPTFLISSSIFLFIWGFAQLHRKEAWIKIMVGGVVCCAIGLALKLPGLQAWFFSL
jgi:hypothetical protein